MPKPSHPEALPADVQPGAVSPEPAVGSEDRVIDVAAYERERDVNRLLASVVHPLRESPRVSVVIPALNEAANLPHVLGRLPDGLFEVVLVDGGSVDDTVAVARRLRPDVRVVRQNRRGKGNALACGVSAARGDIIVLMDADGSADPCEIPAFIDALCCGAHYAKGSRFAPGGGSADITAFRAWGNRWLNRLANRLYRTSYTDLCYGYNAFWSVCTPYLGLDEPVIELAAGDVALEPEFAERSQWGDGFEIETLLNVRVAVARMAVTEVASYEASRIFGRSNLNAVRDGFRVLRTIAAERHRLAYRKPPDPALPRPWESFPPPAAIAAPRTSLDADAVQRELASGDTPATA